MRHRFFYGLQVFGAGMQKKMHVNVDEPGQQRRITEIDDHRVRRVRYRGADGQYAIALDEDFAGRNDTPGVDFEQVRGMQNNRVGGRLRLRG